jgi:hypothetical protein
MRTISRRELLTIAATGAVAIATPARADAPAPFSPDKSAMGSVSLALCRVDWPMRFRKQADVGACPMRISLVKRRPARS